MEHHSSSCEYILAQSSTYTEDELLEQPFIIPDSGMISYNVTEDEYPAQQFYVSNSQTSFIEHSSHNWETCAASLEEVESAMFSGPATSTTSELLHPATSTTAPIEIQPLETASEVITMSIGDHEVTSSDTRIKKKASKRSKKKSAYKHVPHSEKPAHLVAKRNARERRRVEAVNVAFLRLRKAVPLDNKRGKRISKVKILQRAIDYILNMKDAIDHHDGVPSMVYDNKDDDHLFAF